MPEPDTDRPHVSGVVVHAKPEREQAVLDAIAAMDGAEVYAAEGGRLVVVLEAADEHGLADALNKLSLMDDVYAASLVSHHVDAADQQDPSKEAGETA